MDERGWHAVDSTVTVLSAWLAVLVVLAVVAWATGCGPFAHGAGYGDSFSVVVQNASGATVVAGVVVNGGRTPGRSVWTLGPIRPGDSAVVTGLLVPWTVDVTAWGGGRRWSVIYRVGVDYAAATDGRVLVVLQ